MNTTPKGKTAQRPCALLLAFAALGCVSTLHARERVPQLAEDSATTRTMREAKSTTLAGAPADRICEAGAKWIRVGFGQLQMGPYDALTLESSEGDKYTLEGSRWNDRAFSSRALRGDCVTVKTYFFDPASRYAIDRYEFGTNALAASPVVVAGAGDICDSTGNACSGTSNLIVSINPTAVFTAGDNAYESGTLTEYNSRYAPTWGRFKTLTSPSPGNHDYNTVNASGYFDYFNGVGVQTGPAGDRSKGYYSWDVGDWHFIALNTMSGGTVATAQLNWLNADLAANTKPCTAAYWHHPLVSRGNYTGYSQVKPFWDALYAAKADLVLVGHDHNYQRYGKMNPAQAAASDGIRQVLVGTGGRAFYALSGTHPMLERSNANTYGVLKLTLTSTGYTGDFVPAAGGTFTDNFSGTCNKAAPPANVPPTANFSFAVSALTVGFTDGSSDSDGTIASRSWNFGDGTPASTAANPTHNYAAAGTYNVALTVTDNGGASSSVTKPVTAIASDAPPVANFTFTTSNLTASFTDTSSDADGTIASRAWNFGDGATSTATNPSHAYASTGVYSVTLTVADNLGTTASTTRSVSVSNSGCGGAVLCNGVAVTGLAAATGGTLSYTMVVPANATALKLAIAGGSGDADLYVKFGSAPTTSSYDCRPYLAGNAETCNIATAQAGTYYVMLRGYAAFSGVALTGSYTTGSPPGPSFTNTTPVTIADQATITSTIAVTGVTGAAPATLKVPVNITHTYIGDLKIDLVAPNGTTFNLWNRTGSSTKNINQTFTVNASSIAAPNGTWTLRVADQAAGDTGTLNSWGLQF